MKTIFKYKSGYVLKFGKNGYCLFKGRVCHAWKMWTRKEVSQMHKYLTSK